MPNPDSSQYKIDDAREQLVQALPPLDRHPGIYLREVILPQWNLNTTRLAELIKVNRPNLNDVTSGKYGISRELAYRIGALLGDELADFLIAYQQQWDLERERDRRAELKTQITRLPAPAEAD